MRFSRCITLCVVTVVLFSGHGAAKKKKKTKSKRTRCTACTRMAANSVAKVAQHRIDIEPLRDNKIETGRGADRVYKKRFTKTYDVELLHGVEQILEQSCAQPNIYYDLELVKNCRTLRDDHAEELVELLLRGQAMSQFCGSVDACSDDEAPVEWHPPALMSETPIEAAASWGLAVGSGGASDAVKVATAENFFEQIVDLDGDVLLLLYDASTGSGAESKHSDIAPAWEKLAAALRSENEETDADPLHFAAISTNSNDVPVQLPIQIGSDPEVFWFGGTSKDMAEPLFGGTGPPHDGDEFQQEVARTLVMRGRDKTFATAANSMLDKLNSRLGDKAKANSEQEETVKNATTEPTRYKQSKANGSNTGTAAAEIDIVWVHQMRKLATGWAAKPGSIGVDTQAEIRAGLEGVLAKMDRQESVVDYLLVARLRRETEAARLEVATLRQDKSELTREVEELQTTIHVMRG